MGYCTATELRAQIEKTGTTGSASDANLQIIVDAASNVIDTYCNKPDGFVANGNETARSYAGTGAPYLLIDECVEISLVAVKDGATDSTYTSWTTDDWIPFTGDPNLPDFNSLPYTAIMVAADGSYANFTTGRFTTRGGFRPTSGIRRSVPTVQVTARWGYADIVPAVIKQACISLASRWYKNAQSSWTNITATNEMGQLMFSGESSDIRMMLEKSRFVSPPIGRR